MARPTPRSLLALAAAALLVTTAACTGSEDAGPADRSGSSRTQEAETPRPTPSERLGLATGWGPSRAQLDAAARDARRLSVDELAGQVVVARWPSGTDAPVRYLNRLHLGGVVAFDDNIEDSAAGTRDSAAGTRVLSTQLRVLQRQAQVDWPLFLGVDQEGGTVTRVTQDVTPLPSFMTTGAAHDVALTRTAWQGIGSELAGLGFTVDLAPVADVTSGTSDAIIRSRAAAGDPAPASRQARAAAQGLLDAGVLPTLKHFPGHGGLSTDSHVGLPVQRARLRALRETDLLPFTDAIDAGLPAIMVGHIALQAVDPGTPASVSRPVITGLLRQRLGFEGLVVSDALDMAGVAGVQGPPAVAFLRAGGDVVLMPPDAEVAHDTLVRAVRQGTLSRGRLEQAAARMIATLRWSRRQAGEAGAAEGTVGARQAVRDLSRDAITVVAGKCRGALVTGRVVPLGSSSDVRRFEAAAQEAGLALGRIRQVREPRPERTGNRKRDRRRLQQWRRTPPRTVVDGTPVHLVGSDGVVPGPQPDRGVVVATDVPYVLGRTAAPVRIATFGDTPAAMTALADVLTGSLRAEGRLPVDVAGVPRSAC